LNQKNLTKTQKLEADAERIAFANSTL